MTVLANLPKLWLTFQFCGEPSLWRTFLIPIRLVSRCVRTHNDYAIVVWRHIVFFCLASPANFIYGRVEAKVLSHVTFMPVLLRPVNNFLGQVIGNASEGRYNTVNNSSSGPRFKKGSQSQAQVSGSHLRPFFNKNETKIVVFYKKSDEFPCGGNVL